MFCPFPRTFRCIAVETAVLSKSSTLTNVLDHRHDRERESMLLVQNEHRTNQPDARKTCLALSGSNQAREGRLVDALAVRGDEGRANGATHLTV